MADRLSEFCALLDREDKEGALGFVQHLLEDEAVQIVEFYETLLRPALSESRLPHTGESVSIWREHVRSGIVRTLIEVCYPRVLTQRQKSGIRMNGKSAVLLCPDGEYHEIGARMAADYFTLCGFHVCFVGSSVPVCDFLGALEQLSPDYIAVSVSNYFNLVAAKKTFEALRKRMKPGTVLLAGGGAFQENEALALELGADRLVNSFEQISALAAEVSL